MSSLHVDGSVFMATILDFNGKRKNANTSETVRVRAISSKFLTHRAVKDANS